MYSDSTMKCLRYKLFNKIFEILSNLFNNKNVKNMQCNESRIKFKLNLVRILLLNSIISKLTI